MLERPNFQTVEGTQHIITSLSELPLFSKLSQLELRALLLRDQKDRQTLEAGVEYSITQRHLESLAAIPSYTPIIVDGKSVGTIAEEIVGKIEQDGGLNGNPLIISGLSGVGKGATVNKLREIIPESVVWSNGTIFRLLAWHYLQKYPSVKLEEMGDISSVLLGSTEIHINSRQIDILLQDGNGNRVPLSAIQKDLRSTAVEAFVPEIAGVTQGPVINFTNRNITNLATDGFHPIIEGRVPSTHYVGTNNAHRFELVMQDETVLGERRAAQKVAQCIQLGFGLDSINPELVCQQLIDQHSSN